MKQALDAQDGLYTLILKHSDGTWEPRVIGSIVQYLFAPDDPEAVIEKMAAASTRIVSLTITEGGYNISDITGEFDAANPDVVCDLEQGAVPRTTFGLVTEALNRRKKRGLDPFTRHVVRQPAGKRSPYPSGVRYLRPAAGPGTGRLG
jgi:mannitol 2-dehydrogenase